MFGCGGAWSPSAPIAGPSRSCWKRSEASRDSQKSITVQPLSVGPAEWKTRPSGGFCSTPISALTASYCSCVPPAKLIQSPIAIHLSFGSVGCPSASIARKRHCAVAGYAEPMEDMGAPSSYLALQPGTALYTSDGRKIGEVEHVLAIPDDDIFDGVVIDTSVLPGGHRFVDAPEVDEIYERGVVLAIDAAAAEKLPEPSA